MDRRYLDTSQYFVEKQLGIEKGGSRVYIDIVEYMYTAVYSTNSVHLDSNTSYMDISYNVTDIISRRHYTFTIIFVV